MTQGTTLITERTARHRPRTPSFGRGRNGRRGQSLVEFALLLPVLLVFLAGALDLGRVFYANITLHNAAREGAMQAARTPTNYVRNANCNAASNLVTCRVQFEAKGSAISIAATDIDLTCSISGCPAQAASFVTVTVHGQFRLVTPLLSAVFGGQTLNLTSTATAQVEYLPNAATATAPPAPVADFTGTPRSGTGTLTVSFTDTSSGSPTEWQWDFGDGNMSIVQHPTHTYSAPGTYTVRLTAINITGADIETKSGYITVDAVPTATATST